MLYLFTNFIKKMTPEAERFNGWAAMLGFVAAVGAYVTTGQIIPGWFQIDLNITPISFSRNIYYSGTNSSLFSSKLNNSNFLKLISKTNYQLKFRF